MALWSKGEDGWFSSTRLRVRVSLGLLLCPYGSMDERLATDQFHAGSNPARDFTYTFRRGDMTRYREAVSDPLNLSESGDMSRAVGVGPTDVYVYALVAQWQSKTLLRSRL